MFESKFIEPEYQNMTSSSRKWEKIHEVEILTFPFSFSIITTTLYTKVNTQPKLQSNLDTKTIKELYTQLLVEI